MERSASISRHTAERLVRLHYEEPWLKGKALYDAVGLPENRTTFLAFVYAEIEVYPHIRLMPSAEDVVAAREGTLAPSRTIDGEEPGLRWERIASRAGISPGEARRLYESIRGPGSAKRSYTGRGRRFPDMD